MEDKLLADTLNDQAVEFWNDYTYYVSTPWYDSSVVERCLMIAADRGLTELTRLGPFLKIEPGVLARMIYLAARAGHWEIISQLAPHEPRATLSAIRGVLDTGDVDRLPNLFNRTNLDPCDLLITAILINHIDLTRQTLEVCRDRLCNAKVFVLYEAYQDTLYNESLELLLQVLCLKNHPQTIQVLKYQARQKGDTAMLRYLDNF